jgi:hypothetical protein
MTEHARLGIDAQRGGHVSSCWPSRTLEAMTKALKNTDGQHGCVIIRRWTG